MIKRIKTYLANQARKPSGIFGKWVAPRVFNRENEQMERKGFERMNPQKDEHILEVGFGNGRLLSRICSRMEDGSVSGIDISGEMVELAKKYNRKWIEKGMLEIRKASVGNIPYPDEKFDKIFTANTIYFWPEPEINLRELKRVLAHGGRFYCTMRLKERMLSINSIVGDNRSVFRNLYDKNEVRRLFEQAGFHNVEIYSETSESDPFHIVVGEKG